VSRLGSPADDRARVAELDGAIAPASRLIRRGGAREETVCAEGRAPFGSATLGANGSSPRVSDVDFPALTLLPLHLTTVWNSAYPTGDNDGLLWSGRGVSQLATAGATLRYGPVSASLAPEVSWSENRAFDTVPTGGAGELRFANPFYGDGIDLPQRFGAGPFAAFAPGQSYLRADLWNVALGVSSENLWIGPGVRTSILMSSAGPGFPHVFLGTTRPGNIGVGKAEALLFFGRLERSRFIEGGTHPLVSGLVLGYEPRWIPGLHVGAGRVMLQRWEDLGARDFLAVFQSFRKRDLESWYGPGGDNPGDNQLASLFARWVFPASGLELYGEWAREDHEWDLGGLVREPDHSQAYLLGLQKVFRAGTRRVRLLAELTHLQELRPLANQRGVPVYYVHGADLSYTNRGQLLGAWIGPGADAQTLAVDVFHAGGRIGGYVERVRRNDAYYWAVVEPSRGGWWPHDAELSVGARQVLTLGRVELSWEAAASFRHNRDFLGDETNLKAVVGLSVPLVTPSTAAAPPAAGRSPPPP
jgi:hypothetical protein